MADLLSDDPQNTQAEVDPAADFFAREQDQLAGIDDDNFGVETTPAENTPDLVGDGGLINEFEGGGGADDLVNEFGGADPVQAQTNGPTDIYSAISSADTLQNEPEKIKKWREEQKEMLEKKDSEAANLQEDWKNQAKKELDEWYARQAEQLEKGKQSNRAAEEAFIKERDEVLPGQEWERIARHCDFNPKNNKNTKDVTRLRSILLHLKQSGLQRD